MAAVSLALAPPTTAHGGGGGSRGYSSTIARITPTSGAVDAAVLDGDDRLLITLDEGHVLVIEGYEGEPYLRIDDSGAFVNARSPTVYLNADRFSDGRVPSQADAKAKPRWDRVSRDRSFVWHDHRIHWMSRGDPPTVAKHPDKAQRIFGWVVPGTLDGDRFRIVGSLDYTPVSTKAPDNRHERRE